MNISHYEAFELFQKSIDGPLSAEERAELNQHLAACAECQTDAALYRKLETQARARHPIVATSRQDVLQTIHKTRTHFRKRRALKRLLTPLQTFAWAGTAVALALAVMWAFASRQTAPIDTSFEMERRLVTSTPGFAPTPTTPPYPTPMPTRSYADFHLPSYLNSREKVMADVDLNCDGQDERLVNIEAYSVHEIVRYDYGTVGVALQEPYEGSYRQVWDYRCYWKADNGSPACHLIEVEIIASDNCEQFVAVSGSLEDRSSPRLIIFRWDGQNMSVVFDERAADWKATQDPFVITTMLRDHCIAYPHSCDDEEINHIWNGIEFVREKKEPLSNNANLLHDAK